MTPRPRRLSCAVALVLALACDSGFEINATIEIPDEVAEAYSEVNRGVLLVDFRLGGMGSTLHEVAVICGEGGTFRTTGSGDGTVTDSRVLAWLEPTDRPCGPLSGYAIEDDGQVADEDEPQATAMIAAASGCAGHSADAELVLAWR